MYCSVRCTDRAHSTPIVNDAFLQHIRDGLVTYKRGDTLEITPHGVRFNERERGSSPGSTGIETVIKADVYVSRDDELS